MRVYLLGIKIAACEYKNYINREEQMNKKRPMDEKILLLVSPNLTLH